MSTTVKAGWLKDKNGNKFAPKTLSSQIINDDGTLFESKVTNDLTNLENNTKTYTDTAFDMFVSGMKSVAQAMKATQDESGNVITNTYETKTDAQSKLTEAKNYADTAANKVKDDLLNGAGEAYDTLKELGELIDSNTTALDALEEVATNKADKEHVHSWNDLEDRPFYTTEPVETVMLETSLEFTATGYEGPQYLDPIELIEGNTYIVSWNDTEYECVCYMSYNGTAIGNETLVTDDPINDNEPFYITLYYGDTFIAASEVGTHTVKITTMKASDIQLDRKYIKEVPGKIVEGKIFTIDNENVVAGYCAEIFNDYTNNMAIGEYSHAEGGYTTAYHRYSHAEGSGTEASGDSSHAEGQYTKATSDYSHAEGSRTKATGAKSHAEGGGTTASGQCSHAEGSGTIASGDFSHAEGNSTKASGKNQHVQGKYNIEDTASKYAHIIGNGASNARSNAHTLDWNGNAWYAGDVYTGGISQDDENAKKLATEEYVDTKLQEVDVEVPQPDWNQNDENAKDYIKNRPFYEENVGTILFNVTDMQYTSTDMFGYIYEIPCQVSNFNTMEKDTFEAVVNGATYSNLTWSNDILRIDLSDTEYLTVEYWDGIFYVLYPDTIITFKLMISGRNIVQLDRKYIKDVPGKIVSEQTFTVDGEEIVASAGAEIFNDCDNNIATGIYSHAEGEHTKAIGDYSHAEGYGTTASGDCSHAEGNFATASGDHSHAEGIYIIASGNNQHVQGKFNIEDTGNKYAHIVGNGTSLEDRSNAHTLDWSGNAWYQGSVEATALILSSPNGTRFQITVGDDGVLTATEIITE